MPKIKNYTSDHDKHSYAPYRWEHGEQENLHVEVRKMRDEYGEPTGYWMLSVFNGSKCFNLGSISKNKEYMRKLAVSYAFPGREWFLASLVRFDVQ